MALDVSSLDVHSEDCQLEVRDHDVLVGDIELDVGDVTLPFRDQELLFADLPLRFPDQELQLGEYEVDFRDYVESVRRQLESSRTRLLGSGSRMSRYEGPTAGGLGEGSAMPFGESKPARTEREVLPGVDVGSLLDERATSLARRRGPPSRFDPAGVDFAR
jgi:hypothetical protein